jgi:hypothetical protein
MKYVALILLFASCAKEAPPAAHAEGAGIAKAAAALSLAQSEKLSETAAIQAASVAALAGADTLPAATALRCWLREESRVRVREACMLAWAAAGQESPELRSALHKSLAEPTRAIAVAAVRRANFVQTLSEAELRSLISALKHEASWMRTLAALEWLESNKPVDLLDADQIFTSLALPETEGSPFSILTKFAVSHRLGLEKEAGWLRAEYCSPAASGAAATRCLRVLSALTDARFGELPAYVQANLPSRKGAGMLYFQRSFPNRAHAFDSLN